MIQQIMGTRRVILISAVRMVKCDKHLDFKRYLISTRYARCRPNGRALAHDTV